MILYRTKQGALVEHQDRYFPLDDDWDELVNRDDLATYLQEACAGSAPAGDVSLEAVIQTPLANQEIWAAGVTYYRSRTARMEESQAAGGSDFYDRVYHADRPELFLKATPHRAVGHRQTLHLRSDSRWIVPEPELTLAVTRRGTIVGYTIGNDVSERDWQKVDRTLWRAKNTDTWKPMGPWIETDFDLAAARTLVRVNGKQTIEFPTADMLFDVPTYISAMSQYLTLHPGDVIWMGTEGVSPDLKPGDVCEIEITGLGTLRNPLRAEA